MNKLHLAKKVKYASQEELLFMLLNNTDKKFKDVVELWKSKNPEGTVLAGKLMDNILELKSTLNTSGTDDSIKEALTNIKNLYSLILDEISLSSIKMDYARLESAHSLFLQIKDIFEEDRRNMQKNQGL